MLYPQSHTAVLKGIITWYMPWLPWPMAFSLLFSLGLQNVEDVHSVDYELKHHILDCQEHRLKAICCPHSHPYLTGDIRRHRRRQLRVHGILGDEAGVIRGDAGQAGVGTYQLCQTAEAIDGTWWACLRPAGPKGAIFFTVNTAKGWQCWEIVGRRNEPETYAGLIENAHFQPATSIIQLDPNSQPALETTSYPQTDLTCFRQTMTQPEFS